MHTYEPPLGLVPKEARKRHQIPWIWSSQVGAGSWEQNPSPLEKQLVHIFLQLYQVPFQLTSIDGNHLLAGLLLICS